MQARQREESLRDGHWAPVSGRPSKLEEVVFRLRDVERYIRTHISGKKKKKTMVEFFPRAIKPSR